MDSLLIIILLSSNPIISDFTVNFEIDRLFQFITDEDIAGYEKSHILNLKNSSILIEDKSIHGDLVITTSKNKSGHLVYFTSKDPALWKTIQEDVISNSKFTQKMRGTGKLAKDGSMFYSMPVFTKHNMTYKIDIIHADKSLLTDSETQLIIKIRKDV